MISVERAQEISNMLGQKLIKREEDKYYFKKNGKKEYIPKQEIIETYDTIIKYLKIEENALRTEYKLEEVENALHYYFSFMQLLEENLANKNFDKIINEHLEIIKRIAKQKGYEDILTNVVNAYYYEASMMSKLYQADMIDERTFWIKMKIFHQSGKIKTSDIVKIMDDGIDKEIIYNILGKDELLELYKKNKSPKYINYLPIEDIISLYKTNQLTKKDIEKSYLSKNSIMEALTGNKNAGDIYEMLQEDIPDRLIPNSQDFISLLRKRKISKDQCKSFIMLDRVKKNSNLNNELVKCYEDGFFHNRDMFEFIKQAMVEDDILPKMHELQQMMRSAVLFPDAFQDEFITDEELRDYFNVDKLLERKKDGKLDDEFFEFYREILPKEEEEQQEFEQQIVEQLREKEDSLDNMLLLWKKGIVSIEKIRDDIDEDEVIEKADQIGTRDLCSLYQYGILSIEALSIIFEGRTDEIALSCKENNLNESALELMSQEEIIKFYQTEQLSDKNMLKAYQYGILPIEALKELEIKINELENVFDETFESEQIKELFLNRFIDYDKLLQLQQSEIITQEEFIQINKEFDFETAIAQIKDHQIQNEALPQGNRGIRGKYTRFNLEESQRKLPNIRVESRLEYFKLLESEKPEPIYRSNKLSEKAALEGYDYIIAKRLGVVILEKFYEDNTENRQIPAVDNATYILPPVKLIEYLERSNKQDLRQDKNVRYVNHTANWGRNLLKACAEVNPELEKKELMQQYKEVNELLRQEYEENIK